MNGTARERRGHVIPIVLGLTLGTLGVLAPTALAAAPSNDTFAGATVVGLGFSESLDTTEATTDADDAQLNGQCGAPATDASVWYQIQGADAGVVVDVSGSNYSAGVLVGTGSQGSLALIQCGPSTVSFIAASGTTYYVLAIDDQLDGAGNGGQLSISFTEVAAPGIDVTVNPTGKVNTKTGVAKISGSYTCTDASFISLEVDASQRVGRIATISGSGSFFDVGTCDGASRSWSADVVPLSGKFAGGKAMSVTLAYSCGSFECATGYIEQKVQLSGGK